MESINKALEKLTIIPSNINDLISNNKYRKNKIVIFSLLIGQFLSLLYIFCLYIPTYYLPNYSFNFPILTKSLAFFVIGIFWLIIKHSIEYPKGYFFLIIFFETQGYFFRILAENDLRNNESKKSKITTFRIFDYDYVSITLTGVFVILLSFYNLKKYQYYCWHFLSIFISFSGIILLCYTYHINIEHYFEEKLTNKNLIYIIISCICYSISFMFQEINFKKGNDIYIFFIYQGIFSGLVFFIESFILKEPDYFSFKKIDKKIIILTSLYVVIHLLYYSILPFFLKKVTSIYLSMNLGNSIGYIYFIFFLQFFKNLNIKYLLFIFGGMLLNFIGLLIFEKVKIKKSKDDDEENEENNSKSKSENNEESMDFGIEMQRNNSSSYIKLN